MNIKTQAEAKWREFRGAWDIYRRDFIFLTCMGAVAFIPLVVLRGLSFRGVTHIRLGSWFLFIVLAVQWLRLSGIGRAVGVRGLLWAVWLDFLQALEAQRRDFIYLALLALAAFVPLVALRGMAFQGLAQINWAFAIIFSLLAIQWARCGRIGPEVDVARGAAPGTAEMALITIWLAALTWSQFHLLMLDHWWSGTDETLTMAIREYWYQTWEEMHARPMASFPFALAADLKPGYFHEYLILISVFRFGTGLCIYGFSRIMFPGDAIPALAAAAFYIISPTESARYLTTSLSYSYPVFLMVAALWAYAYSHSRRSIPYLLLSFILMGLSLLSYENTIPLFFLIPLATVLSRKPHWWLWTCAVILTCSIFSLRMAHHFMFDTWVYQISIAGSITPNLEELFKLMDNNIAAQATIFRYYQPQSLSYWARSLAGGFLAAAPALWAAFRGGRVVSKVTAPATAMMAVAVIVIAIPTSFVDQRSLPDYTYDQNMRLGFFTAVAQAYGLAMLLMFLEWSVGRRLGALFIVLSLWLTCASAISVNHEFQEFGGSWNKYIKFGKTASLYRSLWEKMPKSHGANAFFVILPPHQASQFGWSYSIYHAGASFFGIPGYQGRIDAGGQLEALNTTGYPIKYQPAIKCDYVIFKANDAQTEVELVSYPKASDDKKGPIIPCQTVFTPKLPLINGELQYFGKSFLPASPAEKAR